jgi:hypothetical protein
LLTHPARPRATRLLLCRRTGDTHYMKRCALPAAVLVLVSAAMSARALATDEIKLKDGTKITGTIVGFEENSFKVKTSYGFAVVQKDQVVSIIVTDASKSTAADKTASHNSSTAAAKSAKADVTAANATVSPTSTTADAAPVTIAAKPVSAPAPQPSAPAKPAAPEPMREQVVGNTYTNETYGFQMYKPPTWKVIEGARTLLPGSITAMGTDDQTTYLLIGQEPAGKSLNSDMDATDHRLREILDNFRPIDEKRLTIAGVSAIERHFRGSVDQKDWSGVVVYVPRDTHVYTIFGMTLADTDLVQIQENVISRAISSLQFTK